MGKVVVAGSANTDMVIHSQRIPVPGETILGGSFLMNPGGKGANQAVAAARLGGEVTFVAKIGNDVFGRESKASWEKEQIHVDYVFTDPSQPSGVALIMVDAKAENCIAVAPGANATLNTADIDQAETALAEAQILLMQLETPIETVMYAAELASRKNVPVILNPAPAAPLPEKLYAFLSLITPNETEAEILTGVKVTDDASAQKAAEILCGRGVKSVIITMGSKGAYLYTEGKGQIIPAQRVKAVDTVAAGDVFNGALAVAMSEEMPLTEAVQFAAKAAAISVTRIGAQSSAPYRNEL